MKRERHVILGLGSNLGDRAAMLADARTALAALKGTRLEAVSPLYETDPVGLRKQPRFLNQVAVVATVLTPEALLDACLAIELAQGRARAIPNGPRTLDIDLLFYEGVEQATPGLTLPHPRWSERAFVVAPLADVLELEPLAGSVRWDALRHAVGELTDRGGVMRWEAEG